MIKVSVIRFIGSGVDEYTTILTKVDLVVVQHNFTINVERNVIIVEVKVAKPILTGLKRYRTAIDTKRKRVVPARIKSDIATIGRRDTIADIIECVRLWWSKWKHVALAIHCTATASINAIRVDTCIIAIPADLRSCKGEWLRASE